MKMQQRNRARQKSLMRIVLMLTVLCISVALLMGTALVAVPQVVIDACDGVVRIAVLYERQGEASTGTGFAVGTSHKPFIVTNYHVVEDGGDEIRLYYDTGCYVNAEVYHAAPERDICILKLTEDIPGLRVLPLQTESFTQGTAVYALGFPSSADVLSGDWQQYDIDDLSNFVAAKEAMTITNGIVSAIRESNTVGNASRAVLTVQTNAAISSGNSGGPLLNSNGCVLGINTMTVIDAEGVHGAVHVDELANLLQEQQIRFLKAQDEPQQPASALLPQEGEQPNGLVIAIVAVLALAVAGMVVLLVVLLKQKAVPKGLTLDEYERTYRRIDDLAALDLVRAFMAADLLPLERYDLNPLLTIGNVYIADEVIALRVRSSTRPAGARVDIYPGYSAPENYEGVPGRPATVYFLGALLYMLITGRRPEEALKRERQHLPAFVSENKAIKAIINRAMEPDIGRRIPDLQTLDRELEKIRDTVWRQQNGWQV